MEIPEVKGLYIMEKPKLLIAEAAEELRNLLSDLFRSKFQICCCADGYEAQRQIGRFTPDVMVVDVMLTGIDGISLLEWTLEQGIRPRVLLTTRLPSDFIMGAATRLGVSYVMLKPWDTGALVARVEEMSRITKVSEVTGTDPASRVSGLLLTLGIRPKLRGFACLREAVLLSSREEYLSVTKVLYPEVAKRCGCRGVHVERNIRSAIDAAWNKRDENVWRLYFAPDAKGNVTRPTNAAFISRLADSIREYRAG